jgi:hypothetical protein
MVETNGETNNVLFDLSVVAAKLVPRFTEEDQKSKPTEKTRSNKLQLVWCALGPPAEFDMSLAKFSVSRMQLENSGLHILMEIALRIF